MEIIRKKAEFLNYFFLLLLFFVIPLSKNITVWVLVFFSITSFLTADYTAKFQYNKNNRKNFYILSFSFLYILYIIGLLYTSNYEYAIFDLKVKFSIFLLPIVFFLIKESYFSKEFTIKFFQAFLLGVLSNVIICLLIALYKYSYITHSSEVFYYSSLSYFFHPSYFSMFLNFAIILLLFSSFSNIKILNQKKNILVVLQLLFSIFIFLLSSKAGIISLIIIYLFYVSIIIFSQKRYKLALLILSSLLLFSIVFLTIMPSVKDRLKVAFYALKNKNEAIKSDGESTSDRILIWETSIDIIKQNLILGVGTGDVKDELLNKYKENGINFAYQQKLNAHNQYLQTFISIGLIGFIVLILSFLLPVIQSIKRQHYIYLMFLFLIAFNILVESMFENQAGVVFYAFFNTFLFLSSKQLADN